MSWVQIFFIGYFAFSALFTILMIGRERTPITPGVAAVAVIIYVGFAFLIAWLP